MFKYIVYIFLLLTLFCVICFGGPLSPEIYQGGVLFKYEDESANKVSVAGSFNNWNADANPLTQNEDGIWVTKIYLQPGNYEYKFLINGNWMDGANLILKVVQDADGSLKIPEIKPPSNIPYSDKIYIDGNYFVIMENYRNQYNNYRWSKPQHDIDLNFWITVKSEIEAYAQLNINNSDYDYHTTLDKAHLTLQTDYFDAGFYKNERIVYFKNLPDLFEDFTRHRDDNIYFFNETPGFAKIFGKNYNLFVANNFKKLKNYGFDLNFIFADNNVGKNDINTFRINYSLKNLLFGITYFNAIYDNGINYNPGSGNTDVSTDDIDGGWLEYPRNSGYWQTYDVYRNIDGTNSKNNFRRLIFDFNFGITKNYLLYFIYSRNDKNSTGIFYADGVNESGPNGATVYRYNLEGEKFSSDKFTFGSTLNFLNNKLNFDFAYNIEDFSITTIDNTDTHYLVNISPLKHDIKVGFKLNLKKFYLHFLTNFSKINNIGSGLINGYFDDYDFYQLKMIGINKLFRLQLSTGANLRLFKKALVFKMKNYYSDYGLTNNNYLTDINTFSNKYSLSYNFYENFYFNFMTRFKYYDFSGGNEDYFNFASDLTYQVNKNISFAFGYGYSFEPDEERELFMPYKLDQLFWDNKSSLVGNTIENILNAENILKNIKLFYIKANLKF